MSRSKYYIYRVRNFLSSVFQGLTLTRDRSSSVNGRTSKRFPSPSLHSPTGILKSSKIPHFQLRSASSFSSFLIPSIFSRFNRSRQSNTLLGEPCRFLWLLFARARAMPSRFSREFYSTNLAEREENSMLRDPRAWIILRYCDQPLERTSWDLWPFTIISYNSSV